MKTQSKHILNELRSDMTSIPTFTRNTHLMFCEINIVANNTGRTEAQVQQLYNSRAPHAARLRELPLLDKHMTHQIIPSLINITASVTVSGIMTHYHTVTLTHPSTNPTQCLCRKGPGRCQRSNLLTVQLFGNKPNLHVLPR